MRLQKIYVETISIAFEFLKYDGIRDVAAVRNIKFEDTEDCDTSFLDELTISDLHKIETFLKDQLERTQSGLTVLHEAYQNIVLDHQLSNLIKKYTNTFNIYEFLLNVIADKIKEQDQNLKDEAIHRLCEFLKCGSHLIFLENITLLTENKMFVFEIKMPQANTHESMGIINKLNDLYVKKLGYLSFVCDRKSDCLYFKITKKLSEFILKLS